MINLKYSEILKLNNELEKGNQLDLYNILLLSNIEVHQSKEVIEYSLRTEGINANVELGDYDNIVQESKRQRNIHATIIFWDLTNLIDGLYFKIDLFNDNEIVGIESKVKAEIDFTLKNLEDCPLIIINKFSSILFSSFNIGNSRLDELAFRLNDYLESLSQKNLSLINFDNVIAYLGIDKSYDLRYFYSSKAPFTVAFFKNYAQFIKPLFMSINGKSKKVLIFDCDNTLWKGVLGEDGFNNIEMSSETKNGIIFQEVQSIALSLSKKGVIIGLCSKNNPDDVDEVLSSHRDMILKDTHITIKKVNWSDKVSNLKEISKELNIGLDSFVFIDDSEFETNLIKEQLPEVTVLEVPNKLHNYPIMLRSNLELFYNSSHTFEDVNKVEMYKQQKHREDKKLEFSSLDDYLSSLRLKITVYKNDKSLIPRIAQMSQKTNQFNLTTIRYTETDIQKMVFSSDTDVYAFAVNDKYGSSGVTGLCILNIGNQAVEINSLLISCRIIGRNIEYVLMDYIIQQMKNHGVKSLTAKFIRTMKNIQVSSFFDDCSFELISQNDSSKDYFLSISKYVQSKIDYIELINNE